MPRSIKVLLEVEEIALGPVMNRLHNMPGIISFVPLLGDTKMMKEHKAANGHANGEATEKKEKKPRRKNFVDPNGVTGNDLVLSTLAKRKRPMTQAALSEAFAATGRAATSSHSIAYNLKKEGYLQNKGDGYTLTKKGRDKARYAKS